MRSGWLVVGLLFSLVVVSKACFAKRGPSNDDPSEGDFYIIEEADEESDYEDEYDEASPKGKSRSGGKVGKSSEEDLREYEETYEYEDDYESGEKTTTEEPRPPWEEVDTGRAPRPPPPIETTPGPTEPPTANDEKKTIEATRIILTHLSPDDIVRMKMTPFTCLPPQVWPEFPIIYSNIPPDRLEGDLYKVQVEACLGDVISQLPCHKVKEIGADWLEIIPRLSAGTWNAVNPEPIACIQWEGVISHMPPEKWSEVPGEGFAKFPEFFWTSSPPETFQYIDPKSSARLPPSTFKKMPARVVHTLPWADMTEGLESCDVFNQMGADQLGGLPWEEIMPGLKPDFIRGCSEKTRFYVSPEGWAVAEPLQLRAIHPALLAKLPIKGLKAIPVDTYKKLGYAYLRGMPYKVLDLATDGEIQMPPVGKGPSKGK